ncbi:MAG: hypothetical protein ABR611_07175 [Chthoniobacterales bacterium]
MTRTPAIGQTTIAFVVALTVAAWFSLSNHCALAVIAPITDAVTNSCPMHSAPARKKPGTMTPCCKELRAIVAKCVTATAAPKRVIGSLDYAGEIFAQPERAPIAIEALDTGPPGCFSFAESVLQQSMLSHAPPVS